MKRRLALAIGCLAFAAPRAAIPAVSCVANSSGVSEKGAQVRCEGIVAAAQRAEDELDRLGLLDRHRVASVIFLDGAREGGAVGSYDVRIVPPFSGPDGAKLRGFNVAEDGTIRHLAGFRVEPGA